MSFFAKKIKPQATPEQLTERKRQQIEGQVEEYVGAGGISTKDLEYGLWYQEHRRLFILALIWFLVLTATVFWAYCLYYFTSYLLYGIKQDQENALILSQYYVKPYHPENVADIESAFIKALPLGDGRYDFVGTVTNHTTTGWASLNYRFTEGDRVIASGQEFVYPGQTKYIIALAQSFSGSTYDLRFSAEPLSFHRFTPRIMPDWEGYKDSHLNFLIQDKLFVPGDQTGLSDKIAVGRLSFNVTNNTAYSFRQAPFLIILYEGSNIVAVDRYVINAFKPKQRVNADISFFGPQSSNVRIEVIPAMNILDEQIYGALD